MAGRRRPIHTAPIELTRCPSCQRWSRPLANIYDHVAVVEGPGGAVSSHSELYLEYLCQWCGARVVPATPVTVEDLDVL